MKAMTHHRTALPPPLFLQKPALGSTIYDAATGKLTIVGSNLPTTIAGWDFTKLKIVGHGNKAGLALNAHTAAATDSTTGSAPSANTLAITFKGNHKDAVDRELNKNGLTASDNTVYNLKAEAGTFTNSAKTTDLKNAILVANWPDINITRATYNATTGQLVISGSNLPTQVSDWDFTKLKIQGTKTPATDITLSAHDDTGSNAYQGSNASASSLTITAKGSKKTILEDVLDTNGTYGSDLKVYNLRAEAGAFTKLPAIADESGNAITVSNHNKTAPTITSIEYDARTGLLNIEGRNYEDIGTWDFTKLKITGQGRKTIYLNTLPTSTNDLTTTILSPVGGATMFVFFKGTHKAAIDALLDMNGKTASDAMPYDLAAEAGTWRNSPSTTVTTAIINVKNVP